MALYTKSSQEMTYRKLHHCYMYIYIHMHVHAHMCGSTNLDTECDVSINTEALSLPSSLEQW